MGIKTLEELNSEFLREIAAQKQGGKPISEPLDKETANPCEIPSPDEVSESVSALSAIYPDKLLEESLPAILDCPADDPSAADQSQKSPQTNSQERSLLREFGSLAIKLTVIIGAILLIFTMVYGLHYNVEPGMNPSVKDGDLVMYYRWDKNYRAGDLILLTFQGQRQVRRVVARAGDTVDISEDGLVINGALQQEPGISQRTERYTEGINFPVTLEENEVFILGDARENATDSRIYGPVNIDDTQGKVITVFRRRNL